MSFGYESVLGYVWLERRAEKRKENNKGGGKKLKRLEGKVFSPYVFFSPFILSNQT